mgnify:CR=1 FL=1
MSNLTLTKDDFAKLSSTTQMEILSLFTPEIKYEMKKVDGELSYQQVRNLLNGLSEKSKNMLKVIVQNFKHDAIKYRELLEILGLTEDDNLTGVWSGITKRSRNSAVANDSSFNLINWDYDDVNLYIGSIKPKTFQHIIEYFS